MIISSSDVSLTSNHSASSTLQTQDDVRVWTGNQRPDFEGNNANALLNSGNAPSSNVQISGAALAAYAAQTVASSSAASASTSADAVRQAANSADNDPRMQLIIDIIELMTGKKINVLNAADLQNALASAQQPASTSASGNAQAPAAKQGWGIEVDQHSTYTETQQTSFKATGKIVTADHQEISFDLSFNLDSHFQVQSNSSIRLGDAKKVDPLVLNFSGDSTQLTSQKFAFDLQGDGKKENISFVQGAGFLVLDKNNNGKIDNGTELFGPTTGNGFSELAAYDSNGDHWIDEKDPVYQKLKIWTKDSAGNDHLQTLKQANVGALYLGNASTPFSLNNAQNQSDGQVRSTGVWISEDGKAHSLQEVDLSV